MGQTSRQRVAAVILAAGYSSRMGSFKPLLPLCGSTAYATLVNNLKAGGCADVYVVTGHNAEPLAAASTRLGVRLVHNPDYDQGMYSSIAAGIAALDADIDACLLQPVDIPLVRPATFRQMLLCHGDAQTRIVYPTFLGKRGHPPRIQREVFDDILAHRDCADGQGLRTVLARHEANATDLPVLDQRILLDMDTQEDYQRLCGLAEQQDIPSADECAAILQDFGVDERIRRHSYKVAEVAGCLARALIDAGVNLNPDRILAGSLLHDILRGQPRHATVGAAAVKAIGFADLAPIVANHMDLCFTGGTPDDTAVVFLADKLVDEDRLVSFQERFQPSLTRYSQHPEALQGALRRYGTARTIAESVCRITRATLPDLLAPLSRQQEAPT
jgi:molybdenum cofactor cytidylyltransferase